MSLPHNPSPTLGLATPSLIGRSDSGENSAGCNNFWPDKKQPPLVSAASGLSLNSGMLNVCSALPQLQPQPQQGIDLATVFVANDESCHQSPAQVVPPKSNGHGHKPSIEWADGLLHQSATEPQPNPVSQPITVTQNHPSLDVIVDWIKTDNIEMLSMLAEQQPNWQALVGDEEDTVDYQLRDVCALFGKPELAELLDFLHSTRVSRPLQLN